MKIRENNYAFIDSQNLNLGVKSMGWRLDFKKFRIYLKDKYQVNTAYLFIGFIFENQILYTNLQKAGYVIVFKPVLFDKDNKPKGNVDANLVLQTMIDFNNYDKAVIISSDGDFYCLVDYLYEKNKLKVVLSPYLKTCSSLLRKAAKGRLNFMNTLRGKLEYKKRSTA